MATADDVHLVRVTLRSDQGVSIASPESGRIKDVDLPVARDPLTGSPQVPTSGVIGSLRAHAARSGWDPTTIVSLFGGRRTSPKPNAEAETHAHGNDADAEDNDEEPQRTPFVPSLVRAMGTRLSGAAEPVTRTTTAIDRFHGSALDGSLRSREHVPAGAVIDLFLCLVGPSGDQLELLETALATWRPVLGGGRGSGYGATHVESIQHRKLDLTSVAGLTAWLAIGGPADWQGEGWEPWTVTSVNPRNSDVELRFSLASDLRADMATDNPPSIPGSSLRGVFRSRAEFVLRTLGHDVCAATKRTSAEDSTPLRPACTDDPCVVCSVFGYRGARSALSFRDAAVTGSTPVPRTHVAIDRFTGGQAPGLLFTEQVMPAGSFAVQVDIDAQADLDIARGLLAVVALDLDDGYVGIGHGTSRGMGFVALQDGQRAKLRQEWATALQRLDSLPAAAASGEGGQG